MKTMNICNTCLGKNLKRQSSDPEIIKCTVNLNQNHQSYNDRPAKEYSDGSRVWCNDGLCHRSRNLPAFICECKDCGGSNTYVVKGKIHRTNGPAVEQINAPFEKRWYLDGKEIPEKEFNLKTGKSNKETGVTCEEYYGTTRWKLNGLLHREGEPAVEYSNGTKEYWKNGVPHRLDGPAVESRCGAHYWWIDGKSFTESEYKNEINLKRWNKKVNKVNKIFQNKEEKVMTNTNTLTQQITQSLSNSHSWRQAVIDTVDVLARNGICFSSGEIARHIRLERSDIQFSFYQVGLMLKDLFDDGDTMSFFDGKVPAVRALRSTSGGYDAYVYGPNMHFCESHKFEVEIPDESSKPVATGGVVRQGLWPSKVIVTTPVQRAPAITPPTPLWGRIPLDASATTTSKSTPSTSKPLWTRTGNGVGKSTAINRSRQANESTAVIHSGGRLAVPSSALQKLKVEPGDTVFYQISKRFGKNILEITRWYMNGWNQKRVQGNRGRSGRLYFSRRDIGTHAHGSTHMITIGSGSTPSISVEL